MQWVRLGLWNLVLGSLLVLSLTSFVSFEKFLNHPRFSFFKVTIVPTS